MAEHAGPGRRPCRAPARQRRPPRPLGPARVGGPDADRGPARSSRCSSRSPGLYGAPRRRLRASSGTEVSGATWTSRGRGPRGARHPRRPEPVHAGHDRALESGWRALPAIRGASSRVALPDEVRVDVAERVALLAWQVGARPLPRRRGRDAVRGARRRARPRPRRRCPWSTTSAPTRRPSPWAVDARPGHPRRRARGSARCARPTSAAAAPALEIQLDDAHGLLAAHADPVGWSAVFGFYTPTLRTTDLDPGPGPAAAQPARGPRGRRAAGDPRRRPQRHLRAAGRLAIAGPKPAKTPKPTKTPASRDGRRADSAAPGVW